MFSILKGIIISSISVLVGFGIFSYLLNGESGAFLLEKEYQKIYYILTFTSLLAGWTITFFEKMMDKWLSWHKHVTIRLILSLALNSTTLYVIIFAVYLLINKQYLFPIDDISNYEYTENIITKLIILLFVTVFIFLIINLTTFSYKHYATGQIASVKLIRRQYELQFEALKRQLSPHYLFNCLNTISSLVYIEPERAETYIRRLTQNYQYILTTKDKKLVTLSEELKFVSAFKFLLKVKFQDALKLTVDIPDSIQQTMLPPLTIQMLVENAVKHNDVSDESPLEIKIGFDENNKITIQNSKNKKKFQDPSFKIGIENIRKRYQYFTKDSIKVLNSDTFSVSLPLLDNQASL